MAPREPVHAAAWAPPMLPPARRQCRTAAGVVSCCCRSVQRQHTDGLPLPPALPLNPPAHPPTLPAPRRRYEGLMLNEIPHNKGVLVFGNGLGGGIQKADRGDRYEGEFDTGFANGMGQYTSTKGKVFRGEFTSGMRHG